VIGASNGYHRQRAGRLGLPSDAPLLYPRRPPGRGNCRTGAAFAITRLTRLRRAVCERCTPRASAPATLATPPGDTTDTSNQDPKIAADSRGNGRLATAPHTSNRPSCHSQGRPIGWFRRTANHPRTARFSAWPAKYFLKTPGEGLRRVSLARSVGRPPLGGLVLRLLVQSMMRTRPGSAGRRMGFRLGLGGWLSPARGGREWLVLRIAGRCGRRGRARGPVSSSSVGRRRPCRLVCCGGASSRRGRRRGSGALWRG